jgi:tetratricopeptide (TPR) repeat protein
MKSDVAGTPVRSAIVSQLRRLLASAHFNKARTQTKFLRLVVTKALKNEALKETEIGYAIIENYSPESHTVRVNAGLVRNKLDSYYAAEGKEDLVRISLPTGPSYRPVFSYHEQAETLRTFHQALSFKRTMATRSLAGAMILLTKVTEAIPEYAPAHIELCEAKLLALIVSEIFSVRYPFSGPGSPELTVPIHAKRALELDPYSYLPHVLLGADHMLRFRWAEAKVEFDTALRLDTQKVGSNLWYAAYLLLVGHTEEALRIVESRVKSEPDNIDLSLLFATFLYSTRDYEKAFDAFPEQARLTSSADLGWLIRALLHLACGNYRGAEECLSHISDIDNPDWEFVSYFFKYDGIKPDSFAGLKILALVGDGEKEKAKEMMAALQKARPAGPLQLAIGYMALGRHGRALAALNRAFIRENILLNWLHLLPIFDPLRSHPLFQTNEAERLLEMARTD